MRICGGNLEKQPRVKSNSFTPELSAVLTMSSNEAEFVLSHNIDVVAAQAAFDLPLAGRRGAPCEASVSGAKV